MRFFNLASRPGSACLVLSCLAICASAARAQSAWVRVNQAGYEAGQPARAFLMTNALVSGVAFQVKDSGGKVVRAGTVGASLGIWSHNKKVTYDVYPIDFSVPGGDTYTIAVTGPVSATSPNFAVDSPQALYSGFLLNTLFFYQTERDGPDYIPNALRTAPGHLKDANAKRYVPPPIDDNGYVDNVPPTPPPTPATDGCFKGFNATGETITSLEVTFADTTGLGTLTCDTADNPPGLPSTVFGADPTCTQSGSTYTLMFSGGAGIAPDGTFIIFEDGAPPGDLGTDSATVGVATPEPDSLLLLSTGALGGLCAFWRRRFGFGAGRI